MNDGYSLTQNLNVFSLKFFVWDKFFQACAPWIADLFMLIVFNNWNVNVIVSDGNKIVPFVSEKLKWSRWFDIKLTSYRTFFITIPLINESWQSSLIRRQRNILEPSISQLVSMWSFLVNGQISQVLNANFVIRWRFVRILLSSVINPELVIGSINQNSWVTANNSFRIFNVEIEPVDSTHVATLIPDINSENVRVRSLAVRDNFDTVNSYIQNFSFWVVFDDFSQQIIVVKVVSFCVIGRVYWEYVESMAFFAFLDFNNPVGNCFVTILFFHNYEIVVCVAVVQRVICWKSKMFSFEVLVEDIYLNVTFFGSEDVVKIVIFVININLSIQILFPHEISIVVTLLFGKIWVYQH